MPKRASEKPSTDESQVGGGGGGGTVPDNLVNRVTSLESSQDNLNIDLDKFATDFDAQSSYFKGQFDNLT